MKIRALFSALLLAGGFRAAMTGQQGPVRPAIPNWPAPAFWQSAVNDSLRVSGARSGTMAQATINAPLPFVPVDPCRMLDTRSSGGAIGSGSPRDATLTGSPCGIPPTAAAVSANLAVFDIVGATGNGVLKIWPTGSPLTSQALLNWSPTAGQIDNASVVVLGTGGAVTVQPSQGGGSIDLVIDVNGYYDSTGVDTQGVTANPLQIALLKWYPASQGATFVAGTHPYGVAFDGASLWVANNASNNVTKLRASDGALLGTFGVGTGPESVAFDGANIWVGNQGDNSVTKLRASDGVCVGTCVFSVGSLPAGLVFDGANIWTANFLSNDVTKLRASDGAPLGTFSAGSYPAAIAFDGTNIWVADSGNGVGSTVTKLRASDGMNLGTFNVGTFPRGLAFDGTNIWVANYNSNTVTKLRASDGTNLGTFNVGSGPWGVAFDGANIWVTNALSNDVTKLRASDGANLGTFGVGARPAAIAFDGANIWVPNFNSGNVSKL